MKKILVLLLTITLLWSLSACEKENPDNTVADQNISTEEKITSDSETTAAEETSEAISSTENKEENITESKETQNLTENTASTEKTTNNTRPTENNKPTEENPSVSDTQPTAAPIKNNDYKCSCGFTCTTCSINDGLCAHYYDHYKDHPAACPHYYNGNPADNYCINYNSTEHGHQKRCDICNTVWPEEKHTIVINKDKSVAGDCHTSKMTVSECTKCSYSIHDYSEGKQHSYGEWVYIDEPCGVIPHYESHCTKCNAPGHRNAEGPINQVSCQGGTATCVDKAVCKWCQKPYGSVSDTNHIGSTEIRDAQSATCSKGYSGDTYCMACNKMIAKGHDLAPIRDHSWQQLNNGMNKCSECEAIEIRVNS